MVDKNKYANYIDGLRAVAVIAVILYHMNSKIIPGGFTGVDIFFVISGFVVSLSVSTIKNEGIFSFIRSFYLRRLARIYPALTVCLLVTFLLSILFIPEAWLSQSNDKTGLYAFFGLSNFVLSQSSGDYFSPVSEFNPFTHTWSLGVEEQFYFVFPLFFYLWIKGFKKSSFIVFFLCFFLSLYISHNLFLTDKTHAFYMIWSRFWELAAGVITFQILNKLGVNLNDNKNTGIKSNITSIAGFLFIALGFIISTPDSSPFPDCIVPITGIVLIISSLHGRNSGIAFHFLTNQSIVFIGKISYSLYLWHWPIFTLFRWTVGLNEYKYQALSLVLTFVFSIFSYKLIEQPPRRLVRNIKGNFHKNLSIIFFLVVVFFGYSLATYLLSQKHNISLSVVEKNRDIWYPEGTPVEISIQGCSSKTSLVNLPNGAVTIHKPVNCAPDFNRKENNVFVIGDSHAMHYSSMLKKLVAQYGTTVFQYSIGGCPFLSLQPDRETGTCKSFSTSALDDIKNRIKKGDIIFMASLRIPRIVDQWGYFGVDSALNNIYSSKAENDRKIALKEAVKIINELEIYGAKIILEAPTPELKAINYRCSDWFNKNNPICLNGLSINKSTIEKLRNPVLMTYKKIINEIPSVKIWDPTPVLCPEDICYSKMNDKPLYFDGDHLTAYSNTLLLPYFSKFIGFDNN